MLWDPQNPRSRNLRFLMNIIDRLAANACETQSQKWLAQFGNAFEVEFSNAVRDQNSTAVSRGAMKETITISKEDYLKAILEAESEGQTVISLARIFQHIGAVRAMEFDINPEWHTLIVYSHHGGLGPTEIGLNSMQPATRYLVPDDRDFFAVYRPVPGPLTVPFK